MARWWLEAPMRMVQTNLREVDADLDVERYVAALKECSANVVLFNVGGIVANYPTDLPCHFRNPFLRDDLVGKVLHRAHQEGIRFIARFDFSKINEALAQQHPDWLYQSPTGQEVNYNGQVHTCLSGAYQQVCTFRVLGEVIDRYQVDGVFFNVTGYQTVDYSGNYYGVCHCENCKRRFRERSGLDLPVAEDLGDPRYQQYRTFCQETYRELFHRIRDFIKSKRKDILLLYADEGFEVHRNESGSALGVPEWNYSGSDHVKLILGSWDDKQVSNTAVHFVDIPYRHAAVSPHLTALRLAQDLVHGGWLDFYVIGTLDRQDDRAGLEAVKDLYAFHAHHQEWFSHSISIADACLVEPGSTTAYGDTEEYQGLFRILSQSHLLFDVMDDAALARPDGAERLGRYQIVVLPAARHLDESQAALLDEYVRRGGKLLVTGHTATCDERGRPLGRVALECAGIAAVNQVHGRARGSYLRIRGSDKVRLNGLNDLDIAYLDGDLPDCAIGEGSEGFLSYIPPAMFGPPEKCYYSEETEVPALVLNRHGRGLCVYFPWEPGRHYQRQGNPAHARILMAAMEDLLAVERTVKLCASPLVEVACHRQREGRWWRLGLVNMSGQLGPAFHPPIPIHDIEVQLKTGEREVRRVFTLHGQDELALRSAGEGFTAFTVPAVGLFEVAVIEFQPTD